MTTQHYARILDIKVSENMKIVKERFAAYLELMLSYVCFR
jgi:hypothetical protein